MLSAGGAYGARLTGAGWGGCIISLVKEGETNKLIQHLAGNYYTQVAKKPASQGDYMFATRPGQGAGIFVPPPAGLMTRLFARL